MRHEPNCVSQGSPLDGWADPDGCDCLRGELDAAHQHLAEGATMMEALLADREELAAEVSDLHAVVDACRLWCGGDESLLPRRVQRAIEQWEGQA